MNARVLALVPCMALALVLAGCGPPSKEDLLAKAKNGQAVCVLLGETVTIEEAGGEEKKN